MQVTKVMYMLWVSDMDKSVGFYRDVIGLDAKVQSPGWSELAFGNATVALHLGQRRQISGKPASTSRLAPLTTACRELESAGGHVVDGPYDGGVPGLRLADVEDLDGNRFQFSYHGK